MRHGLKWRNVWKDALRVSSKGLSADVARKRFDATAAAHKASLASVVAAYVDGKIDEQTFTSELAIAKRDFREEVRAGPKPKANLSPATNRFFAVIESSARASAGAAR